jgi:hypothetical protein
MVTRTSHFSVASLAIGFIAAAIAVVTVHQGIIYALGAAKLVPATSQAWSLKPMGPFNVPTLLNGVFWGGLWGILFAAIWPKLPGGAMWLRGLIFGLLVALFSNWMLVPFIKGTLFKMPNQSFFGGYDPQRMLVTLLILGGFGLALGVIYDAMRRRA